MSIPFHKRQLGTGFTSDGGRNTHVISNGRNKVNQLHGIISNRNIHFRLFLLSVLRPSIEYGSEVWKCNRSQTNTGIRSRGAGGPIAPPPPPML